MITSVIPFMDRDDRRIPFEWVLRWHEARGNEVIIAEGDPSEDFNKSRLINQGAARARGDILMIGDAECVVGGSWREGVEIAMDQPRLVMPFNRLACLSSKASRYIRKTDPKDEVSLRYRSAYVPKGWGGFWIIQRDLFLDVLMDEGFRGHGYEDEAFHCRLSEPAIRLPGILYHQQHKVHRVGRERNYHYFREKYL